MREPSDLAPAFPAGEAHFLALEIQYLHNVIESQKPAQRERAVQHFARKFRILQEVIRTLPLTGVALL